MNDIQWLSKKLNHNNGTNAECACRSDLGMSQINLYIGCIKNSVQMGRAAFLPSPGKILKKSITS